MSSVNRVDELEIVFQAVHDTLTDAEYDSIVLIVSDHVANPKNRVPSKLFRKSDLDTEIKRSAWAVTYAIIIDGGAV